MDLTVSNVDIRVELKKQLEISYKELSNAVSRHLNKSTAPINAEDLEAFPLGRWKQIGSSIRAKKKRNRFLSYLSFDIEMDDGAKFAEHFHSDVIESTEVIKGEMLDTTTGVLYIEGDVAHWEEGVKHTPMALKETKLHVLFKRTKE